MLNRKPSEYYCPCPKCGSDRLEFSSGLDCINSGKDIKLLSYITCLSCFYRVVTREIDSKIDPIEENRKKWNSMWLAKMKGKSNG